METSIAYFLIITSDEIKRLNRQSRINRSSFVTKDNFNTLNSKINVVLHQAQLSGDEGALSEGQCSTPQDGYDGRLKLGKKDGAMHPGQHLTVLSVMTYSKQVSKVIIENNGLLTKTTKGVKEAGSTLQTWSPYSCFFSSSCVWNKDPI